MFGVSEENKRNAYDFGKPTKKRDLACKNFKLL
jgi:hypothetical protein